MNITDLSVYFAMRQRARVRPDPTYTVLMLRDLSVGELVHRLRGTGLAVTTLHGQTVIHVDHTPEAA